MSGQALFPSPPLRPVPSPDRGGDDELRVVPVKLPSSSPLPEHKQQQTPPFQQQPTTSPTHAQSTVVMQTDLLVYPSSVAKHEAVVADRNLFFDTLKKFHAALGTKLMIPTIGGKELDLHLLYVEVTSCGGLEQVYQECGVVDKERYKQEMEYHGRLKLQIHSENSAIGILHNVMQSAEEPERERHDAGNDKVVGGRC